jgi:hypothetical protein
MFLHLTHDPASHACIKVVSKNGEPDLCENCWLGPRTSCFVRGRERRCPTGKEAGTPACAACIPRRPQPCGAGDQTDIAVRRRRPHRDLLALPPRSTS